MRTLHHGVLVLASVFALGLGVAAAAGPDDRTTAEAVLKEVAASPRKDVATEMAARSRAALERGARLRASGDEPHARLADGLARTWAEAARDVVRAVEVEEKAQTARRAASDAGAVAQRERALLEEGVAQSGRLRAQLDAVTREAKEQPARTSTAATADTTSRAKPPPEKATPRDGGAP